MRLFQMNFPVEDPFAGQQSMANLIAQQQHNLYAPRMNEAALQHQSLANALAQAQLPYAGPRAAAELANVQQMAPYHAAQTQATLAGIPLTQAQAALYPQEAKARMALQAAQAGLMGQEAKYLPYKTAAQFDPITALFAGRQLMGQLPGAQKQTQSQGSLGLPPYLQPAGMREQSPESTNMFAAPKAPMQQSDIDRLYGMQYQNMMRAYLPSGLKPGMTYTDPFTGQQFSQLTGGNVGVEQTTQAAIDRVSPLIQKLSQNWAPFMTAEGMGQLHLARAGNLLFGKKSELPSQYAEARANSNTAAEGLIKAWGLRVTNHALNMMKSTVVPIAGESSEGYSNRIVRQLQHLQEIQGQSSERQREGVKLEPKQQTNYAIGKGGKIRSISDADIKDTAQKHGISEEEVKRRLGIQ